MGTHRNASRNRCAPLSGEDFHRRRTPLGRRPFGARHVRFHRIVIMLQMSNSIVKIADRRCRKQRVDCRSKCVSTLAHRWIGPQQVQDHEDAQLRRFTRADATSSRPHAATVPTTHAGTALGHRNPPEPGPARLPARCWDATTVTSSSRSCRHRRWTSRA